MEKPLGLKENCCMMIRLELGNHNTGLRSDCGEGKKRTNENSRFVQTRVFWMSVFGSMLHMSDGWLDE